jgi:DNA modification methylase
MPGDIVFDPFAGTGTTLVVAHQLKRNSIGVEIDPEYVKIIKMRLKFRRPADNVLQYYDYYKFTPNLSDIWAVEEMSISEQGKLLHA